MKIKYDIQEKYDEVEIHLCGREKTAELLEMRGLLENLLETKIKVHRNQEYKTVAPAEIIRIYSLNKRVYVRTCDECYEVNDRIYMLEELLQDRGFVRISNSELVNARQIEKMDMSYAGTLKMYLKNGDETYVSRRYIKRIKEVLF